MARPMRLVHSGLGQYFIVHESLVYGDLNEDGRIAIADRYSGAAEPALLAAAQFFADYYDAPYPGAKSQDREISSGGRLNDKEIAVFTGSQASVLARRPDLLGHLDFFDRASGDGLITVRENFRSWRALGYGRAKSVTLALGSALVFGRAADGFGIDVERIAEKRPAGSTGIYGADGNVDPERLAAFASAFEAKGVLTHDELRAALAARAALGRIPKRQFESLFALTERANGARTITREQFVGLFDNSLFWVVASMPHGASGRRL